MCACSVSWGRVWAGWQAAGLRALVQRSGKDGIPQPLHPLQARHPHTFHTCMTLSEPTIHSCLTFTWSTLGQTNHKQQHKVGPNEQSAYAVVLSVKHDSWLFLRNQLKTWLWFSRRPAICGAMLGPELIVKHPARWSQRLSAWQTA